MDHSAASAPQQDTLASLSPYLFDSSGYAWRHRDFSQHGTFRSDLPSVQRNCDQTKLYAHGDPLQYVDWRAFARTDTLLIRQDIQSARVRAKMVIDARDSMFWPDTAANLGATKFSVACRMGLHLAARHVKEGQRASLAFLLQGGAVEEVEILSVQHAFELYEKVQPEFLLSEWEPLFEGEGKKPTLVYVVSDLLSELPDFPASYGFILHLLHSGEWDVSWMNGGTCYYEEQGKREWKGSEIKKHQTHVQTWAESKRHGYQSSPYLYKLFTERSSIAEYLDFIRT